MKKKLLTMASVCLILILATLPLSCGEVEPGPGPTPPTPPVGEPEYGGVLRIIIPTTPRIIGLLSLTGGWLDKTIASSCIELLFRYKDSGGACIPWLAAGWKEDPVAKTYTISLRKGIKFHDGSDFNAEVCKWNLDFEREFGRGSLVNVKSVDIIDDYTVRLNLSQWDNLIPSHLSTYSGFMHSKAAYEKHGEEWMEWNPVGTGPFKFVSADKDVFIKFERFDGYWGGKPYLDGVEWLTIIDPVVALIAFQKGEADGMISVSPKDAKNFEAAGEHTISTVPSGLELLVPDGSHSDSIFADLRVRQACDYALNRQAIADALGYGYWLPTNQFYPPESWGSNPDVVGYPYNPEKARQLLAEAGYANGFKTQLYSAPGCHEWMTAVQGNFAEVGIDAEIELCTWARVGTFLGGGWQDSFVSCSLGKSAVDDLALLTAYCRPGSTMFHSTLRPPELWDAVLAAIEAPDRQTKQARVYTMNKLMIDKYAVWHPVITSLRIAVMSPEVHDDAIFSIGVMQWSPEKAWLSR